ncbi:MAG: chemotaxis protein CheW [Xenococcaceae cyanobacterium]
MNTSKDTLESSQLQKNLGDPYLKLQLDQRTSAALPMKHAKEVLVVAVERITSMPNMPACVLGLLNQRSRVLWVVDLPQMLDLQALERDVQNYNIAIVRVGNTPLGLLVKEVKGVMRTVEDSIQSPIGTVASGLIPYLRGCVLQETSVVLVLDAEAIVNSPILHNN